MTETSTRQTFRIRHPVVSALLGPMTGLAGLLAVLTGAFTHPFYDFSEISGLGLGACIALAVQCMVLRRAVAEVPLSAAQWLRFAAVNTGIVLAIASAEVVARLHFVSRLAAEYPNAAVDILAFQATSFGLMLVALCTPVLLLSGLVMYRVPGSTNVGEREIRALVWIAVPAFFIWQLIRSDNPLNLVSLAQHTILGISLFLTSTWMLYRAGLFAAASSTAGATIGVWFSLLHYVYLSTKPDCNCPEPPSDATVMFSLSGVLLAAAMFPLMARIRNRARS